jgi:hypothetical protein
MTGWRKGAVLGARWALGWGWKTGMVLVVRMVEEVDFELASKWEQEREEEKVLRMGEKKEAQLELAMVRTERWLAMMKAKLLGSQMEEMMVTQKVVELDRFLRNLEVRMVAMREKYQPRKPRATKTSLSDSEMHAIKLTSATLLIIFHNVKMK